MMWKKRRAGEWCGGGGEGAGGGSSAGGVEMDVHDAGVVWGRAGDQGREGMGLV